MIITGNYVVKYSSEWSQLPLQEIYLECDTSSAPVTINLFKINETSRFWNVKIHISDVSNNASANNITVVSGAGDTIDEFSSSNVVINTDGGSIVLSIANETSWISLESVSGGVPATPIFIDNTNFVDLEFGNDSTAEFQNPAKPFLTVASAQANLIANLTGGEGTIYFRASTYTAMTITFTSLMKINYYFEPSCLLDNPRFISPVGTIVTAQVLGYAKVFGTYATGSLIRLNSTGGSTLNAEFDEVNITVNGAAAVRTDSTGVPHNLTIKARRFIHTISNGLPIETFNTRGASNLNLNIDYLEFNTTLGSLFDFRSSGAVKGIVNANINVSSIVVNGGDFTNIANLLPQSNLVYNCPKVICNNLQNNIIRFDGEVGTVKMYVNATVSGTGYVLWTRESLAITSLSNIYIDGLFVTNSLASIPVNIQSLATTHNIIFTGDIQNNTVSTNTIFLDDNSQLSLVNASIYHNPASATDIIFLDTGANIKLINSQAFGNNTLSSIEATAPTNVMAQNFATNKAIGVNITSLLVATPNFVVDANFTLPKISN